MFFKFYKAKGDYSNKRIRQLAKELNVKKIGHLGILDPLAHGLMIVATNEDTRLLEYIQNKDKVYIAKAKLFWESNTLDITGNLVQKPSKNISEEDLIKAINKVSKFTSQIPPVYSAKKINGKKAYEYARENKEITLKPQQININELKILSYSKENCEFEILADVSHGTYIRTLLCDIASLLNTTCVMSELKRLSIGKIQLNNLHPNEYEQVKNDELFNLPIYDANEPELKLLLNGASFKVNLENKSEIFILNPTTNEICAVGLVKEQVFYPKKVFLKRCIWKI